MAAFSGPDPVQQTLAMSAPRMPFIPHGHKRRATLEYPNGDLLSMSDRNVWYYPMHGHDSDDEELEAGRSEGNWGHKNVKGVRWVRRGKITAWGPEMEEWEAEERARKRIKLILPQERRSPSPPTLPHLARSPSPPLVSPYPPPTSHHLSYTSFVLDKSVTHTFRCSLIDELEEATNGLIEGEGELKRALGRLWQVVNDDAEKNQGVAPMITKREDEDDGEDEQSRRVARAPDLTPAPHKAFLSPYPAGNDTPHFSGPEMQLATLEKDLSILRELQDDGREYVERLEEIREGLGEARAQRDTIWDMVRERAIAELQEVARATARDG